jgi:hypothetical protein
MLPIPKNAVKAVKAVKAKPKSKYSSTLYMAQLLQTTKRSALSTRAATAATAAATDYLATMYIEQLCVTLQRIIVNKRAMEENLEDRIFLKRGFSHNELYFFLDYVRLDTLLTVAAAPLTVGMMLRRQGKSFETRLNAAIHGVFLKVQQWVQNAGFPLPPNLTIRAEVFEHNSWLNVHVIVSLPVRKVLKK